MSALEEDTGTISTLGVFRAPYTRAESITTLSVRDARLVRKVAKHLFVIDHNGTPISYERNVGGTLDIIAVLGPCEHRGIHLKEAVLLEVGYGRSRPYHSTKGDARIHIHRRRKYVSLTSQQLAHFWPSLEECLLKIAEEKVSRWKSRHVEVTTRYHVVTNSYGLSRREKRKPTVYLKGVRFSVSMEDPVVLGAFLQSEFASDRRQTSLKADLTGAVQLLSARLREYEECTLLSQKRIEYLNRQSRSKITMCVEFLRQRNFPPHQLYLILRDMSPVVRHGLESIIKYTEISSLREIEWWGSLLEHSVPTLSKGFIYTIPVRRNGEGLRKVYDPKKRKWTTRGSKKQDFAVFEIVPT